MKTLYVFVGSGYVLTTRKFKSWARMKSYLADKMYRIVRSDDSSMTVQLVH